MKADIIMLWEDFEKIFGNLKAYQDTLNKLTSNLNLSEPEIEELIAIARYSVEKEFTEKEIIKMKKKNPELYEACVFPVFLGILFGIYISSYL
jgi:hypothetical protein